MELKLVHVSEVLFEKHHNLDAGLWVNSGVGQSNRYDGDSNNDKVSYSLSYSTTLFK